MNIIGSVSHLCNIDVDGSVLVIATCDHRRTFVYISGAGDEKVGSLSTLEFTPAMNDHLISSSFLRCSSHHFASSSEL